MQIDWYILTKLDFPHLTLRQSINSLIFQDEYQLYLFIWKQPKFFKYPRLFNILIFAIDLKCFLPMICRHNLIKCMTWIVSSWRRGIYRLIICRIFSYSWNTVGRRHGIDKLTTQILPLIFPLNLYSNSRMASPYRGFILRFCVQKIRKLTWIPVHVVYVYTLADVIIESPWPKNSFIEVKLLIHFDT